MIRKRFAGVVLASTALVLGGSLPASADRGDLAPTPAGPTTQSSIIDFYNTWMFCEETWLVALDQMYPDDFSVSECMDVIETHGAHHN